MSEASHSEPSLKTRIDELVRSARIVVFMKGTKSFPQCGFSQRAVAILKSVGQPFKDVNVLSDPGLRDGIKEYSSWPTIPQIFIDGKFVGGSDILAEMHETGELATLLGVTPPAGPTPPKIELSPSAARAFAAAMADAGGDVLRFETDEAWNYELYFGPKQPGDLVVETGGVRIHVPEACAALLDGVRVDHVDGPDGGGFKIQNPKEPSAGPTVRELRPDELKAFLDSGKPIRVFDVRTAAERRIAHIAGSTLLDEEGTRALEALPRDTPIVLYCHHGVRSRQAANRLVADGFETVMNLTGGIDAWSVVVEPNMPRY
ncbi:MAG: Grx4 family monothiol glutaredoxin [Polyangiaceae bacterium]|nr:Grx4 family monothiol glutaredoxin [Polyangiaceae bacterium]